MKLYYILRINPKPDGARFSTIHRLHGAFHGSLNCVIVLALIRHYCTDILHNYHISLFQFPLGCLFIQTWFHLWSNCKLVLTIFFANKFKMIVLNLNTYFFSFNVVHNTMKKIDKSNFTNGTCWRVFWTWNSKIYDKPITKKVLQKNHYCYFIVFHFLLTVVAFFHSLNLAKLIF